MLDFERISEEAHRIAREHGFHDTQKGPFRFPVMLLLLHSELSEAVEEFRTWEPDEIDPKLPDKFIEEIADVFIRLADMVAFSEIGIERFKKAVWEKMEKNEKRPYRHGGKRI